MEVSLLLQLSDLLQHGFTLQEGISFLQKIAPKESEREEVLQVIWQELGKGVPLYQVFQKAHFSALTVSKIKLALLSGNLSEQLSSIAKQAQMKEKKWKTFIQLISYPFILVFFLLSIMMTIKYLLLPNLPVQEMKHQFGYQLIDHFPQILLWTLVFILLIAQGIKLVLQRQSPLQQLQWWCRIPLIRSLVRYSITITFCEEWGNLLNLGIETRKSLEYLQEQGNLPWIQELACALMSGMQHGQTMLEQLEKYTVFQPSLFVLLQQGEAKGNLGSELLMYAEECFQEMMHKIDMYLQWLQPIIFLSIGLMIISLYILLLFPMYDLF